MFILAMNS